MPPLNSGMSIVLQYPDAAAGFVCQGFLGGDVMSPVLIVVDGLVPADKAAAVEIGAELERQIRSLPGLTRCPAMSCGGSGGAGCHAVAKSECLKIYVRISGTEPAVGTNTAPPWDDVWQNSQKKIDWRVIPGVPLRDSHGNDPWQSSVQGFPTGSNWDHVNACRWQTSPTEIVPAVIAHAGLAPADQKVFISYIRQETASLADQLFEQLTQRGFDVFLDRCSVPVGVRFQERLMQELDDKAVVVLLHSAKMAAKSSYWVEQELARIKQYRLGLVVLSLPDGAGNPIPVRPDISPDDVFEIPRTSLGPSGELNAGPMSAVMQRICQTHSRGLYRRRLELLDSLGAELVAAGKTFQVLPGGRLSCAGGQILLGISPRPPELIDFCQLDGLHTGGASNGLRTACLTPAPLVVTERKAAISWLGNCTSIRHVDQENLRSFVRKEVH